ncbi:uncharacterized protein [Antedon mediterranea]|uniref:uncharacterized protein n=1 Tax=Antedon mediterranea TaxID=105859 RepID=UPI003AF54264
MKLRCCTEKGDKIDLDDVPWESKKTKNAKAQRLHLKKLKENPKKYAEFRKFECSRLKIRRLEQRDEVRARDNAKAKIRMQRMRQRKKDAGINTTPPMKTRKETNEKRQKWRDYQRSRRANQSSQKKRRILEKRREAYALNKQSSCTSSSTPTSTPFPSNQAKRKALSRSWRVVPKSPNKFAEIFSSMVEKSTPRKRAALKKKGILSPIQKKRLEFLNSTSVKPILDQIRKSRKKTDIQLRRQLFMAVCVKNKIRKTLARKHLGLSWSFLTKPINSHSMKFRKQRSDALSQDTVSKVLSFYDRVDIARELPDARSAVDKTPGKVMECTMKTAYKQFKAEYPTVSLSFTKFSTLKPANYKPVSKTKLLQCLCEYCINVTFKVESLYAKCIANKHAALKNKYEASSITVCEAPGMFPKNECIDRTCDKCGVDVVSKHLQPLMQAHGDDPIKWKVWVSEAYTKTNKNGTQTQAKHFVLKEKVETVNSLVSELTEELKPFSKHMANAKWQGRQFELLKNSIPDDWSLLCMDFGQNFNCHFQDEAQSAHWSYEQATIHPIVAYYKCLECGQPMHESCIFISDDRKHDYHAVQHFVNITNQHLVQQGLRINNQVQFSDGSPVQYKCKSSFSDASHGMQDFG